MRIYVTPQDFVNAKENGISEKLVKTRVYEYGWSVERAITTPVQKHIKNRDKWIKIARRHGVGSWTFQRRISKGVSLTIAASYPATKRGRKPKFAKRTIDKAKENGINRTTFLERVKCGWSVKDALTIPPINNNELKKVAKGLSV